MNSGDKEWAKMKEFINRKNGFTLLEVVISVAILAVLAVSLIPLISYGYGETITSGKKSTAIYKDAESMEANLNSQTDGITSISTKTISITFGTTSISVPGKLYTATTSYDSTRNPVIISAFTPN